MKPINKFTKEDYLRNFLQIYWLRPETALFRALDCIALQEIEFIKPILDVGCGDGLFSFIRAGGSLQPEFDMYHHVGDSNSFFSKNEDIYNHFDENGLVPRVVVSPNYSIDMALDHKEALLKKAAMLKLYKEYKVTDVNMPLPVKEAVYQTIFCNILYWLENVEGVLHEFHRVLTEEGKVVLLVPNNTIRDYSLYQRLYVRTGNKSWEWLSLIDRGRSDNIKQAKSYGEWERIFNNADLQVCHHRGYLSKTMLEVWDVGLRPISSLLIEMANKLSLQDRTGIKQKWIELMLPLIKPLCELEWFTDKEYTPGFHLFVLERM